MPIAGSPKKLAQDLAEGYLMLSPPGLRNYTAGDLKTILTQLALVARELRQQQIPLENSMALKSRNQKLSRLNQAEVMLRAYAKKLRIPL